MHRFQSERVETGIVHARGNTHGCRSEVLHLLGVQPVIADVLGERHHVIDRAARMAGHEVGDKILAPGFSFLEGFKPVNEPIEYRTVRLIHYLGHMRRNVLRGDFKVARDMGITELVQIPGTGIVSKHKVVPDTGANKYLFHARYVADLFEEVSKPAGGSS